MAAPKPTKYPLPLTTPKLPAKISIIPNDSPVTTYPQKAPGKGK